MTGSVKNALVDSVSVACRERDRLPNEKVDVSSDTAQNKGVIVLFTINIESLTNDKIGRTSNGVKTTTKTNSRYPPRNPFNIAKYKNKDRHDDKLADAPEIDLTSEEEVAIKESIDLVKKDQFEINTDRTTETSRRSFHEKYGTVPPRNIKEKPKFKDYLEKYALTTVWEQIDKERILTGKNITKWNEMLSLVKGIDDTDELLSLKVENGRAKLPVPSGRRFRPGKHNLGGNMFQFNFMHIHQYMIELMKQAIYQARNRMTFMQDLRNRHRTSGLYKMGYLFAKTDQAAKVFGSVAQKSFRMCNMIRQGFMGIYRPYHHFLDIVYAIERMQTKWFEVDLLQDMIVVNDNIVRVIFEDKDLKTPRDVAKAFDAMFKE